MIMKWSCDDQDVFWQCLCTVFLQCVGNTLILFGNVLAMFRRCFGDVLVMFCQCFGILLAKFCECFGIMLAMSCQCFGIILAPFLEHFPNVDSGVDFGRFVASFWFLFGSRLTPFGILLAPFGTRWHRSGSLCHAFGTLWHFFGTIWHLFGSLLAPFWIPLGTLGLYFLIFAFFLL